jgi:hypothetical protein
LFNNLAKVIVDAHNTVEHYNNPNSTIDGIVTHEMLTKFRAYNLYVSTLNNFVVKFSKVLKMTGNKCEVMKIKNSIHDKLVNGTLRLKPIDISQFTVLEDATIDTQHKRNT